MTISKGTIRKGYVDVSAGQVHHRSTAGTPGGPVVVLLHQTAASSVMYEAFMALLPADVRAVAFDTPGFGQSFRPVEQYSIDAWVGWFTEAVDALGIGQFHVVGHHTGAVTAAALAAALPDRVLTLTMVGALGIPPEENARWHTSVRAMDVHPSGAHLTTAWWQVGTIDTQPVEFPPDLALQHREVVDKLTAGDRWHEAYLAVFSTDVPAILARVTCPSLLVIGRGDVLFPYVEPTQEALPGLETVVLEGGGYVLDQAPELVLEAWRRLLP